MSVPKDLYVNLYTDHENHIGSHRSRDKADIYAGTAGSTRIGGKAHHYRLVEPKREVLAYVVKRGATYWGFLEWTQSLPLARRFPSRDIAIGYVEEGDRIVALVRKATP